MQPAAQRCEKAGVPAQFCQAQEDGAREGVRLRKTAHVRELVRPMAEHGAA